MSMPNIVAVVSIYGGTAQIPVASFTAATYTAAWVYQSGTGSVANTSLPGLSPASGSVQKIENIVIANATSAAATISVAICPATTFSGVSAGLTYLAYNVSVPPNASLIVTDKSTSFYLGEYQSVGVISSVSSGITATASFETIT
jgi:hypothetical protein